MIMGSYDDSKALGLLSLLVYNCDCQLRLSY